MDVLRPILALLLCASLIYAAPAHRKHRRNHRSMVVSISKYAGQGAGIGMLGGPIGIGVGAAAGSAFGFWQDRRHHHRPARSARRVTARR